MRSLALVLVVAMPGCAQLLGLDDPGHSPEDAAPQCTSDPDCGAHEYCLGARTCECVAGYSRTPDACSWTGVVRSPGFDDPTAWTLTDATIDDTYVDPDGVGMADPGVGKFTSANGCAGTIEQTFLMPRFSKAESLVAEMHYRSEVPPTNVSYGVAFKLSAGWVEDIDGGHVAGWQTRRVCLGAAHFAPEASVGAGVEQTLILPRPVYSGTCAFGHEIDRFEIKPAMANECPAPGTALNGDANGNFGWTFRTQGGATAGFVANGGEADSPAARLVSPAMCDWNGVTIPVSPDVSDATGSPRFSFITKHTNSMRVELELVDLFGRSFYVYPGGAMTITRACVPAPLRGITWPLSLDYSVGMNTSGCSVAFNGTVTIDSVGVANDPQCGTDPFVADGGFDSDYPVAIVVSNAPNGFVRKTYDVTKVHAGRGAVEFGVTSCQPAPNMKILVATPPPGATGGPAVKFWYRVAQLDAQTMFHVSSPTQSISITSNGNAWTQTKLCLDPRRLPGREQLINFQMAPFNCTSALTDSVFFDDVTVEYDATCPN